MTDSARSLIPAAARRCSELVHAVPADAWEAPTPCTEWSVRDVLNHLVSEHRWAPHLLHGETIEQVGDRYDGDLVGDTPAHAWDEAIDESVSAFAGVESDQMPVHLSFGTAPVDEYASQMLVDLVVHAWDLARGAGLEARLEPRSVEGALAHTRQRFEGYASSGMFAEPVTTMSNEPQDELLAMLGRDPDWTPPGA